MLTIEHLKETQLFHDLSDQHLQPLANSGLLQHYGAGFTLFQENSIHHTFYIVFEGSVALDLHPPRRSAKRILTIGPGEILAWSAILADGRMSTSATTLLPTQLMAWPAQKLLELCQNDHEIGFQFMKRISQSLSKRLTATRMQLLDMLGETAS